MIAMNFKLYLRKKITLKVDPKSYDVNDASKQLKNISIHNFFNFFS